MKCEECGSNAVSDAGYDDPCETYECEACGAWWEDCPEDEDGDFDEMPEPDYDIPSPREPGVLYWDEIGLDDDF